jgi:amidase
MRAHRWVVSVAAACSSQMVSAQMISAQTISAQTISAQTISADTTTSTIPTGSRARAVETLFAALTDRDKPYHAITAKVPSAHARAEELDRIFGDDVAGPLDHLLIAVKANIDLSDVPATAGSKSIRTTTATDAPVVSRVREAGGVVVAVTNMDTWARGTATISQAFGSTGNAWNPDRSPYGSSGGGAVAVARGFVDAAIGTDTCGSLRLPASANAIYGLRPTVGAVSRAGIVPLSPTQDVVGPMARTVDVLARVFVAIRGPEPGDRLTFTAATPPKRPRTYRVGVLKGFVTPSTSPDSPLKRLARAGIDVVTVKPVGLAPANVIEDEFDVALAAWRDGRAYLDANLPVHDPTGYRQRLVGRVRLRAALTTLLDRNGLDALVYPTTAGPPGARGVRQTTANCWIAANSGLPALAVPGEIVGGFPVVGVDLLGRAFDESTLFDLARLLPDAPRPPGT